MTARGIWGAVGTCVLALSALYWVAARNGRIVAQGQQLAPRAATGVPALPSASLYVLAIGVSEYDDAGLKLRFAADDARAVAAALQRQSGGPLYRQVKAQVLTDGQVTRESVLDNMNRFLGQAGPGDVAVVFLAGHGVQDLATGSYYFLPHAASPDTLLTAGVRMTDFDEVVRVIRRNARAVVVMLDTCHAGAMRLAARNLVSADDLPTRLSAGENFYLLAAAKPGNDSKERAELGHGVFTYAVLEGLQGPADADGDGFISVSELFGYVARLVPRLTGEQQHPYNKMEGTDLVFAADLGEPRVVPSRGPVPTLPPEPTPASTGNTIGVMQFNDLRGDTQNAWVGKALRVAFNTELSKVRALQVYSPELIDRVAHTRGADDLTVAQQLGIGKFLTGSFHVVGTTIRIDARIIDAGSGVQEGSDSVEGDQAQFFELQKRLVISMLRRLPVELSAEEGKSIQRETNTDVDAYRVLLESEGLVGDAVAPTPARSPAASPAPTERHTRGGAGIPALAWVLTRPAYAVGPDPAVEANVRVMLEAYRGALQDKDLERLATLYVVFSQRQRDATRAYLQNAGDLVIEFSDISVTPHADGVAVSYTRRDRFTDGVSGKPQRLEVRLTKILVNDNGHWKMAGGS